MKKVKTFTFDPTITRPVTLRHVADDDLIFKSETENFNFGLQLKAYNVLENLKDRKSNYNSAYFLSDLQSLSSILELDTPYEFVNDSKFTTYIKLSSNYIKAENSSSSLSFDSNFNYLDSKYFFTVTLSTNRYLYITKQFGEDTYYAYCSSESIYLSSTVPGLSSHLFEYVLENNNLKLYPYKDLANPLSSYQVIMSDTLQLTSTSAGNTVSSVFDVNRNTLTRHKKKLNNALTFYLSSYNNDGVDINLNTTTNYVSNNYLGFTSIYSLDYCDKKYDGTQTIGFDIIPLKNQATVEEYPVPVNHYNSQPDYLNREYEKIQSGYNEEGGYDKIYLSYNTGTKDIHFPPSRLTYFTTPSSLSPYTILNINDSKIDSIGAVASNRPQMADKVYKRRLDIKSNNFTDDINATYLCSWLSGNEAGEKLWVDRYYNPDAVDYSEALSGTAFYNTVTAAGAQSTYMFDISSRLTFETNNDYAYYHIGERDYINHIKSFERYNLAKTIDLQSSKGASISTSKEKEDTVINLDGDTFGKFITDYKGDACCSFWLSANDYSKPFAYKILGNYFEDGFGIFNTDFVTPNLFIPVGNKILLLNTDLEIYDEIELLEGTTPVNIKGIARKDNFSDFYVIGENNVIYVYNSNPNLVSKIDTLSGVSNLLIEDIDVTNNRIYVAFNPTGSKGYYYFDFSTNKEHFTPTVSSETYGDKVKIFANPKNKNVSFLAADSEINTGNELAIDDNNSPFTIRQKSPTARNVPYNLVYKNAFVNNNTNVIEVSGGNNNSVLTNVIVDDEDNIITIHDNNRISKLKNTRELISFKDLTFLSGSSTKYLDVILDFEENVYKKYYLIVEKLSDKTLLHKIDKEFNLVKTKNLGRLINSLELTRSITSFYYLKKYDADKNKLKVLLKTKPKFTQTGTFKKVESKIVFDISQLNPGSNHFAININLSQGWMDLYVNGKKFERTAFAAGTYLLDNPFGSGFFIGALSTPYYLTLASRLQLAKKYFVKNLNIKGFRLHKRVLDLYEIRSLVNYHGYNKDSVWSLPIGQRSYVDTIDRVFKFDTPERNTNYFEVDIKNININNAKFRNDLKAEITKEVNKLIPYYDVLRNIRIDEGIVNKDFDPGTCDIIIEDRIKINVPGEPEKQAVKPEDPVVTKYYCEVTETDGKGGRIRNTPHDPSDPLYGDVCCLLSPYDNVFKFEYRECPPVIVLPNYHDECWSEFSREGFVYKVNDTTGVGEQIIPAVVCCKDEADQGKSKTPNFTVGPCPEDPPVPDPQCPDGLIKNENGVCVCPDLKEPVDGSCDDYCTSEGTMARSGEVCCEKDGVIYIGAANQYKCEEPRPYCDTSTSLPGVIVGGDQDGQPCCGMLDQGTIIPVTEFGDCGCEEGQERDEEGNCITPVIEPTETVTIAVDLTIQHNILHNPLGSGKACETPASAVTWADKLSGTDFTDDRSPEIGTTKGWFFQHTRTINIDGNDETITNIEIDYIPSLLDTTISSNNIQAFYDPRELGLPMSIGVTIGYAGRTAYGCDREFPVNAVAGLVILSFNTTSGPAIKNLLSRLNLSGEASLESVGTYVGYDWISLLNNWVDTTFLPGGTLTTDPLTHSGTISLQSIISGIAGLLSQDEKYNGNLENGTYDSDKALVIGNATLSDGRVS